jgi:CubicO group peptidase (beta-lactamase class C family)
MMRGLCCFLLLSVAALPLSAQAHLQHLMWADSIRAAAQIPALGYAVVSADSILEIHVGGKLEIGGLAPATELHPFRLGSNTKAITGLIAAIMVQEGKIKWETRFFDLFPDWKKNAQEAYHELTLLNLLSFRNWLPMWTYSFAKPNARKIKGDAVAQRMHFGQWALRQPPVHVGAEYNHSNLGYVLAGLMLEQASGLRYEQLLQALGKQLGMRFYPMDYLGLPHNFEIRGHDAQLQPTSNENVRLNWLMAAGNARLSLADYCKFLMLQLQGLQGKSPLLPRETFEFLHFGLPEFAVGWFWEQNAAGQRVSHNLGNPGNYVTRVLVDPAADRAYVVFASCMTEEAYAATAWLMGRLGE